MLVLLMSIANYLKHIFPCNLHSKHKENTEHAAKEMGKESKHFKKSMNRGKKSEREENEEHKNYRNKTETKWD